MDWRRGTAEGNRRIIYEVIGVIAVLLVIAIFIIMLLGEFRPEAVASAKAVSYAASCSALINIVDGGDVPGEIQEAWEAPASPDLKKSCAETEDGPVEFRKVKVECDPLDSDKDYPGCRVMDFHLPQNCNREKENIEGVVCEHTNEDQSYWKNFILGFNDPRYLIYYESFPHGPSTEWEPIPENLAAAEIVTAGVSQAIVGAVFHAGIDKVGKVLFRSTADEGAQALRNAGTGADEAARIADDARDISRATRAAKFAVSGVEDVPVAERTARQALGSTIGVKMSDEGAEQVTAATLRRTVDDLLEYQKNQPLASRSIDDIMEGTGSTRGVSGILDEHMGHVLGDKAQEVSFYTSLALRGGDEVENGVGVAGRFTPEQYWEDIAVVNVHSSQLASNGRLNVETVKKMLRRFREADKGARLIKGGRWTKEKMYPFAHFISCRSNAIRIAALMNSDDDIRNNEHLEYARQMASTSRYCPGRAVGDVEGLGLKEMAAEQVRTMMGVPDLRGLTVPGEFGASAITIGYVSALMESRSSKYKPGNLNAIVLKRPFPFPADIPFLKKEFRLNKYANYYYVALERHGETGIDQADNRRFYLISPMTQRNVDNDDAKIEVYHKQQSCQNLPAGPSEAYMRTQDAWHGGEATPPPGRSLDEWDNEVLIRNVQDLRGRDYATSDRVVGIEGWVGKKTCPHISHWDRAMDDVDATIDFVTGGGDDRPENREVETLMVNPTAIPEPTEGGYNYGYNAGDVDETIAEGAMTIGALAAEGACFLAFGVSGPGGFVCLAVVNGVAGSIHAVGSHEVDLANMWPER